MSTHNGDQHAVVMLSRQKTVYILDKQAIPHFKSDDSICARGTHAAAAADKRARATFCKSDLKRSARTFNSNEHRQEDSSSHCGHSSDTRAHTAIVCQLHFQSVPQIMRVRIRTNSRARTLVILLHLQSQLHRLIVARSLSLVFIATL